MDFSESFEKVTNRIFSFKDVDRAKFWLDTKFGVIPEWHILWEINSIFKKQPSDQYAIQCNCGRLDLINEEIFNLVHKNTITDEKTSLECNRCKEVNIDFIASTDLTPPVRNGLREFEKIFKKAEDENYMTLCYFLWCSLSIESEQLNAIQSSIDIIFDQYMKAMVEFFLDNHGLYPFKFDRDYHENRQHIFALLGLNHIIEIDGLYDLIISLAIIAEGEQFLVGDDGRSIHGVGTKIIRTDQDEEKDTVKFKITFLKDWLKKKRYGKLAELIRLAFNYEVRNAFSHSDYMLTKTGVYLRRNNREVSYQSLHESFIAAYYLLNTLVTRIKQARDEFINSGGYSESGWEIEPCVSEHGVSVQISTSSPKGSSTGKKRTGLSTIEAGRFGQIERNN